MRGCGGAARFTQWTNCSRIRLRHELDRVPLWRGNHVGVKQLCEDTARYLYLPRVRDDDVILAAIRDGVERLTWASETFAYAESWDEQRSRYNGLRGGSGVRVLNDATSVVVKPDIAATQQEADRAAAQPVGTAANGGSSLGIGTSDDRDAGTAVGGTQPGVPHVVPPAAPGPRRFHGTVALDPIRLGRDAGRIAEEVVQHLSGIVGAEVEVTLEIHCNLPEPASEKLVRDVTENCRTLKFTDYGFEEA